jgi:glycosyltransferase involved in cell wall biosynthesis
MAARIATLLADPALATEMGLRAHKKVLTNYDPSTVARRFERLYMEVAHARSSTRM